MGATPSSSASASEAAKTCTQGNGTVTMPTVKAVASYPGHLLMNDLGMRLSEVRVCVPSAVAQLAPSWTSRPS